MGIIIGNTTATPNPRPDWNQTDVNKADYIKNKPIQDIVLDDGKLDITKYDTGLYRFYSNVWDFTIQAYNGEGYGDTPWANIAETVYRHYVNNRGTDYLLAYIEKGSVGITTTFIDITNNVKILQNSYPDPDIDVVYWDYYKESYLTDVVNANVGMQYTDHLMYVNERGLLKPLKLGSGLQINKGIFESTGGDSAGKMVGNGGEIFNDYDTNKAYGPYSTAHGAQAIAGTRGYYYTSVEFSDDYKTATFYLSKDQTPCDKNARIDLGETWTEFYEVGDLISYVHRTIYNDQGNVTTVDIANHSITIAAPEGKTLGHDTFVDEPEMNDQTLYSTSRFDIGPVALGWYAFAVGENVRAQERGAVAIGRDCIARGENSFVEGRYNVALRLGHAEGYSTVARSFSHSEGYGTQAMGERSHAEGSSTLTEGTAAHAEGSGTKAIGNYAHSEGQNSEATGVSSHAENYNTKAIGNYAHSEGWKTEASGLQSHAEGYQSKATGKTAHAEGTNSEAAGENSHAETSGKAYGKGSHAEGGAKAYGEYSHAEGSASFTGKVNSDGTILSAPKNAHAEGQGTAALAPAAHSEGISTKAGYVNSTGTSITGEGAHAEGSYTEARGDASHTEGERTLAVGKAQHAEGRFNLQDKTVTTSNPYGTYAHIVGGGTSTSDRKNIHTVDWTGNAWYAGKISIGTNNEELATIPYVNESISSKPGLSLENGSEIFNDYDTNKAYGAFATAHGTNNIAGVKGFYYTRVEFSDDLTEATFYLSAHQLPNNPSAVLPWDAADRIDVTEDWSGIEGYNVGSVISYVLNSKHLDQGKVTAFDKVNHTVTIAAIDGTLGVYRPGTGANYDINGIQTEPGLDDQTLYSITQPEVGLVSLGWYAFVAGEESKAYDRSCIALGRENVSRGQYAYTEGRKNTAYRLSHAEGYNNQALGEYAHAEGGSNKAIGNYSHAEGANTEASGTHSHTEGKKAKATASYSHAEGDSTNADGNASHAEGESTHATNRAAHAEGYQTWAKGGYAHAEGYQTQANGDRSHAEGNNSIAEGNNSHAETGGKAYGNASHAETGGITYGDNSHAEAGSTTGTEGIHGTIAGKFAHAEGDKTQAIANNAHAEGSETKAGYIADDGTVYGQSSHTEGYRTETRWDAAHAEGVGTVANAMGQHAQGRYNEIDETATKEHPYGAYSHIIGAGSSTARKNIHTVDWSGNAWYAGTVETTGIILTSPNGTKYRLTVKDDGTLTTVTV